MVRVGEDQIDIGDIKGRLYPACKFSLRHVASAKYYQADELAAPESAGWSGVRQVAVHRRVDWVTGAVETHAETN